MLAERFQHMITGLGMAQLEHPLFYRAPVGIRFEIGCEGPVYLDTEDETFIPNPDYVLNAFQRALEIYQNLPEPPSILRADAYPDEKSASDLLAEICCRMGLPLPHEQVTGEERNEDGETYPQIQFYWDLSRITVQPEWFLREIILSEIGGWPGFVSTVYLAGPGPFLYHLYDDRGLDVLGSTRELLLPLYLRFHDWILSYNRAQIDRLFAPAAQLPSGRHM